MVTESPRPLTAQRHTIPPHVEAAVLTALEKLLADRFATAAQFAEALGNRGYASVTATAVSPCRAPPRGRPRRPGGGWAGRGCDRSRTLGLAPTWSGAGAQPLQPFLRPSEALQPSVNGSINVAISADADGGLCRPGRGRPDLAPRA